MHELKVHYLVFYATAGGLFVEDFELADSGVVFVVGLDTVVGVLLA